MEIKMIEGAVCAVAENLEDVATLMSLAKGKKRVAQVVSTKRKPRMRACKVCGKKVRYMYNHMINTHKLTPENSRTNIAPVAGTTSIPGMSREAVQANEKVDDVHANTRV